MTDADFVLKQPALSTRERMAGLSTETKPTLSGDGEPYGVGTEFVEADTGTSFYWDGSAWQRSTMQQKFHQFVEAALEIRDLLEDLLDSE